MLPSNSIEQSQTKQSRTLLIGQLLDKRKSHVAKIKRRELLKGFKTRVVYIVRDGEVVLYVGSTNYSAADRIDEHVKSKTPLGIAIRENQPHSTNWTVEMISVDKSMLRKYEYDLIRELHPLLNTRGIHHE